MIQLVALLWLGVTVTLPPEGRVRGTELVLGDFAAVTGDDAGEIQRTRAVSLGYAPAPGYNRLLEAAQIERELSAKLPGVQVRMGGSKAVRIWPVTERIEARAIEAAARAEIERLLAGKDASIDRLGEIASVEIPAAARGTELRSNLPAAEVYAGQLSVPVRIAVDGAPYRTVWTQWSIGMWAEQPLLLRDVRQGEALVKSDVEFRRMERTRNQRAAPPTLNEILSARAARDLRAGQPLEATDLTRPNLVERGAVLFLEVTKGAVSASVVAVAQDPGALGDTIRVQIIDSKREMAARIVARDLVRIDLSPQR